ncbi:MAG: hypothetical protein O3B39_06105 [Proteobacteria bacterium]|nr:hypothetical protein [Pseudomonadota bacterium]
MNIFLYSINMIEGGRLNPQCNFEFIYTNFESNEIKSKDDLLKAIKDLLWHRNDKDTETYPLFELQIENKDGKKFKIKTLKKGELIPKPTKKMPFQLIHEHILEDASYSFNYVNEKDPLNVEYLTYDGNKCVLNITQKKKDCEYNFEGDGGTQDQCLTFRFLDKKGKIKSFNSNNFARLPLEITEDNEKEYSENLKKVADNFFKQII